MTRARDLASSPLQSGVKNLLINGDFRVWPKGTSGAWSGNAVISAGRWVHQYVDFTPAQSKQEDTIGTETVDTLQLLKNGGTYASGEITQKVETAVAKYLRGQTVTFSFWIKKVGATFGSHSYDCWIGDSETVDDTGWTNSRTLDRSRATRPTGMSGAVTFVDNNWKKISITRTLSSDTNTIYCTIYSSGTPDGQGIRVARCQLERGSVASDFELRPYAFDNEQVSRFYYEFNAQGGQNGGNISSGYSRYFAASWNLPTTMRATPSIVQNITITTDSAGTQSFSADSNSYLVNHGNMGGLYSYWNGLVKLNAEF